MGGLSLKIKTKDGEHILTDLTSNDTIDSLKKRLAQLTNIRPERMNVLVGFPPKNLDIHVDVSNTLAASGVSNGDKLIVDEKPASDVSIDVSNSFKNVDSLIAQQLAEEVPDDVNSNGILLRQVVPSDNSCLFTSVGFLLNGRVEPSCAVYMRKLIAGEVEKDKDTFTEGMLGRPNNEYCDWIQKSDSWGGAIEISILSSFYGIEFSVVDISNAIINNFGEDKNFGTRSFLLFDGIHYDPLYLERADNAEVKTVFPIEDEEVMRQAKQLAQEAKSSRQFTDVDKFSLRCNVCHESLKGQIAAQQHAKATGHTDFGEI